jgi:AraC-like DNA-binding protein
MDYVRTRLKDQIKIKSFISVHYFEYHKKYSYKGERHDFWEFVYADKGDILVVAEEKKLILKQGEIIFHKPGEFHNIIGNGVEGCNSVILSFDADSPAMKFFQNKILTLSLKQKRLLALILEEAKCIFVPPYNDPEQKKLIKNKNIKFGSEQLFKMYVEQLLISLIRDEREKTEEDTFIKERENEELAVQIEEYLSENVWGSLNFDDVCHKFSRSKTSVKHAFKNYSGKGVMEFYNELKIEAAKKLIREETLNFSEISEKLSFSSVHYFSRHFKSHTGMTPSQYVLSVKSMTFLDKSEFSCCNAS